ncbi:BQ5605_C025g10054 [Microbotryum silenes-dioicae]|uniref:BQ5605_C025g10054 protein n=1 Tax=Microbotryum silenes-dioicae TaxID=796604 RepID=A0A2X0MR38_9BASI|nr:BQ5605_C025g10054 [Microbotryum silenes-dioicae]
MERASFGVAIGQYKTLLQLAHGNRSVDRDLGKERVTDQEPRLSTISRNVAKST